MSYQVNLNPGISSASIGVQPKVGVQSIFIKGAAKSPLASLRSITDYKRCSQISSAVFGWYRSAEGCRP
jgi:hypothetical protein